MTYGDTNLNTFRRSLLPCSSCLVSQGVMHYSVWKTFWLHFLFGVTGSWWPPSVRKGRVFSIFSRSQKNLVGPLRNQFPGLHLNLNIYFSHRRSKGQSVDRNVNGSCLCSVPLNLFLSLPFLSSPQSPDPSECKHTHVTEHHHPGCLRHQSELFRVTSNQPSASFPEDRATLQPFYHVTTVVPLKGATGVVTPGQSPTGSIGPGG